MNSDRMFINYKPGNTFLDKLTGKTKVRTFLILIVLLISTWDIRIIFPMLVLVTIALFSLKPNWKKVNAIMLFIILVNLFNLFLIWVVSPDYGAKIVGGSTLLFKFSDFYIITSETLWYFFVRFTKFFATFILSLVFIQSITPSEIAAGLYSLKINYKICMIVSIAFRYIPDISRDFNNIKTSLQLRGLELDSKKTKLMARIKQYILILAPLIITSFDRVENIANAMDLRGFGKNKKKTFYCEHEETKDDKKMKIFYLLALVLLIVLIINNIFNTSEFSVWAPWIK